VTSRILVIGDGAWGKALAHVAAMAGHDVKVWSRANPVSADYDAALLAIPAQSVRDVLGRLAPLPARPMIVCAKGIERATGLFMHEVLAEVAPQVIPCVLSGPSFAADVMRSLPTAVTLAAPTLEAASQWSKRLSLPAFRIYAGDDVRGVEIGGAMKNVLAIACGISDGRTLGDSARAALTTRGFAELARFGRALGARTETLMGLSGLGDLLLTCSSPQSRNYSFGFAIGRGLAVHDALAAAKGVVEGAHTAKIAHELALRHGIDMPIVTAVSAIVDRGVAPDEQIAQLLARPVRDEID
jgi:glycerol-3-phosphate dehydrogenase (NAD(P)+)